MLFLTENLTFCFSSFFNSSKLFQTNNDLLLKYIEFHNATNYIIIDQKHKSVVLLYK